MYSSLSLKFIFEPYLSNFTVRLFMSGLYPETTPLKEILFCSMIIFWPCLKSFSDFGLLSFGFACVSITFSNSLISLSLLFSFDKISNTSSSWLLFLLFNIANFTFFFSWIVLYSACKSSSSDFIDFLSISRLLFKYCRFLKLCSNSYFKSLISSQS